MNLNGRKEKRFLFNTQFKWRYSPVEYSLALALRNRGYQVLMLGCNGLPRYCELATHMVKRPNCNTCSKRLLDDFERFGLPYRVLGQYITENDLAKANRISSTTPLDELMTLTLDGVPVGRYAWINQFQYYHGYPFDISGSKEEVFRNCVHSTILLLQSSQRLIDRFKPDKIVTVNGKCLQWAPIVAIARQKQIPYITWEDLNFTSAPAGAIFAHNSISINQSIDPIWPLLSSLPLTQREEEELDQHFSLWANGDIPQTADMKNHHTERDPAKIRQGLGLRPNSPIVALFPNVSWDTSSLEFDHAFKSGFHWVFETVALASKFPDIEFVVRAHPGETCIKEPRPGQFKTTTPICNEVRKRFPSLPNNLKLIESTDPISSYVLGQISSVVMVYLSTLGLEFALRGKRPWVAGRAYYSGKNFTLDLESPEHLRSLLNQRRFDNALSEEQMTLARRFAHAVRLRRSFPFPFLDGKTFNFDPPMDAFKPGGNQVLDDLCRDILEDRFFIDVGTGKPGPLLDIKEKTNRNPVPAIPPDLKISVSDGGKKSPHNLIDLGRETIVADSDLANIKATARTHRFDNWHVKLGNLQIMCGDLKSFYIAAKDIFLHRIYDINSENSKPLIIDGGGHIGLFTLFAKQKYPDATVLAFEPDEESWRLLELNVKRNNLKDVHLIKAGLHKTSGRLPFGSDHSDGSSLYAIQKEETIDVVRLSDYISNQVDFLKLNIEGAEFDVISEIQSKLPLVNEIAIEYHGFPELSQSLHEILKILDEAGFRYVIHDYDYETNPATKPPIKISKDKRFFLLIRAKRIYPAKSLSPNTSTTPDFGNLRRLQPVSRVFGADRMTSTSLPLCWYYIRGFLDHHRRDIKGRVLEVGENRYTVMYGGPQVSRSDILHVTSDNPKATIVASLADGKGIPSDAFDCIILTQTYQCLYDVAAATATLYRILKPGGVLLATFPGISQISRYDMDRWGDYWRFTTASAKKMFEKHWPSSSVTIQSHGNVLVANAYLQGLVSGDLQENELSFVDPDYQMLITVRAEKPMDLTIEGKVKDEQLTEKRVSGGVPQMIAQGWDQYAMDWRASRFKVLEGHSVRNLGDEWTAEDVSSGGTSYGLEESVLQDFAGYLSRSLFDRYLPTRASQGLEIGPGGGRITALLVPKTDVLHLVDASESMLGHLKKRFAELPTLRFYCMDGTTLPALPAGSLDYVLAFDVFVHFEPRLIFWYLKQIHKLLKPGGVGIIHYSNVMTPFGWKQYEMDLEANLKERSYFAAFGVMCPELMERFLNSLGFEIISSDTGTIPRDAVAVFRKQNQKKENLRAKDAPFKSSATQPSGDPMIIAPQVLLYHRVADDALDPQLLCVSPDNFEQHLQELTAHYRVVPLRQLLMECTRGEFPSNTVAITFDDGYTDNLVHGLPLLEKYHAHATIFVTSEMVDSEHEFWWDELDRIFLRGHTLPDSVQVQCLGTTKEWRLATPELRLKAYDELCALLRQGSAPDANHFVKGLLEWAKLSPIGRPTHRVMTKEQLRHVAASPWIEIGAHSVTHSQLSQLGVEGQRREVVDSKRQLEGYLRAPVPLFSYPFGNTSHFTAQTASLVRGAGFEAGIANIQGNVKAPFDPYSVPRHLVRNWQLEEFSEWLKASNKQIWEARVLQRRNERLKRGGPYAIQNRPTGGVVQVAPITGTRQTPFSRPVQAESCLPKRSTSGSPSASLSIVHIGSHDITGGAAKVGWRLAASQRQAGHSAVTLVGNKTSASSSVQAFSLNPHSSLAARTRCEGFLDYQFQGSHELVNHPWMKSADVLHLHNLHGSYFNPFSLLPLSRMKPVVWTLHDMQALTGHCAHAFECERWQQGCGECPDLRVYPSIAVDSTRLLWKHKQLLYANSPLWLVTPSEWLRSKVSQSLLKDHPVELIYNGVDTEVFRRYGKQQSRRRWNIPANTLVMGCVATKGALSNPWKGGEYLLQAFRALRQKMPDLCLVNIGSTQDSNIPGVIDIPPLEDETDLAMAYSALDFFLYTSIADNCPLVILEALACGLPIVTFATGGVPELVRNGQDGFVCRYKDTQSLIEKVLTMARDVTLRQSMGHNARQRAIREFDQKIMAARYDALYRRCIESWTRDPRRSRPISLSSFPEIVLTDAFQRSLSGMAKPIGGSHSPEDSIAPGEAGRQKLANHKTLEGFGHFELGRWKQALSCFDTVLGQDPVKQGTHFLRARCLEKLGRVEEAKMATRAELAIQPQHPDALQLLRELDDRSREPQLSPQGEQQEALALCSRGAEMIQNGNTSEALSCFERALLLEPGLLGVHYARAVVLEQLGRWREAEAALRRELELQPNHLDSQKLFRSIRSKRNHPRNAALSTMPDQMKAKLVNHGALDKQREFWNVSSMYEAMFERVYVDGEVAKLPLNAKIARWNASVEASVKDVLRSVPWDPSWRVLEIGCGVGRLVKPLRERFACVDGVDISEKMVEFSRQYLADGKQNGQILLNNGCDLQLLADSSYDFVFSMIVFQHIRSISVVRSYFSEIARVLKPGGYFRLQVFEFNPNASRGRFDEEASPDRQYGFAGNGYTADQLRGLFLEEGYTVEGMEVNTPWIWATARSPLPLQSPLPDMCLKQMSL